MEKTLDPLRLALRLPRLLALVELESFGVPVGVGAFSSTGAGSGSGAGASSFFLVFFFFSLSAYKILQYFATSFKNFLLSLERIVTDYKRYVVVLFYKIVTNEKSNYCD